MNELAEWLRPRGFATAAEAREGLGISPATLSRLFRGAGPEVLRLGRGRATRYALLARVSDLPSRLPVYRVDEAGEVGPAAELLTLSGGGTVVRRPDGSHHHHPGLPPFAHDMAPAGYLGRRFAQRHADAGLPARLLDWSDAHRLLAIARWGEDAPGDLLVGEECFNRFIDRSERPVSQRDYPRLADEAAEGGAGSSAAGERPKFAARRDDRHLLVKFTIGDGSPSDRRWRDLMACEAIAARVLDEGGVPAAEASVVDVGERRFLEVRRFDRVGASGRRGVLSLGAIDDERFGSRDDWASAAGRLFEAGLIGEEDRRRLVLLEAFGRLIGNDDRHFGNVSFHADELAERPRLRLAPAYDMLPMAFSPTAAGVPRLRFERPRVRAHLQEVWAEASELSRRFWAAVAEDEGISDAFREFADER